MIAILDYGAGNLRSVELAFARIGADTVLTRDPAVMAAADGLVLPGVGAFADAMAALRKSGVVETLKAETAAGKPLLGICLGMQALFDRSEEGPGVAGLSLIPGEVRRLPEDGLKVPHMGWNTVTPQKESPLLAGIPAESYLYFVHSYACFAADPADILLTTEYGLPFHAAAQRGNIFGVQFHPERSGAVGERLLKNFVALTEGGTPHAG